MISADADIDTQTSALSMLVSGFNYYPIRVRFIGESISNIQGITSEIRRQVVTD